MEIKEIIRRLESADSSHRQDEYDLNDEAIEAAVGLLKAKEEGRCIVLPCPTGTPVHIVYDGCCNKRCEDKCADCCEGYATDCDDYDGYANRYIGYGKFKPEYLNAFGKTVFLTYAEAKASIKNLNT